MLQALAVLDLPASQRVCCKSTVQITFRNSLLTLFFFCRVKLEALRRRDETRREEKEMLWKAYVCLRNEESLRKREKTNSFPRDWCLRARPRLNGSFYIFQLGKASALFPLSPTLHCDVDWKKKKNKRWKRLAWWQRKICYDANWILCPIKTQPIRWMAYVLFFLAIYILWFLLRRRGGRAFLGKREVRK